MCTVARLAASGLELRPGEMNCEVVGVRCSFCSKQDPRHFIHSRHFRLPFLCCCLPGPCPALLSKLDRSGQYRGAVRLLTATLQNATLAKQRLIFSTPNGQS